MTNVWNVTEQEYKTALARSRDSDTFPDDSADYWQLCRFYRGQEFYRDAAARALNLIRTKDETARYRLRDWMLVETDHD
jgi:hypothetical protein